MHTAWKPVPPSGARYWYPPLCSGSLSGVSSGAVCQVSVRPVFGRGGSHPLRCSGGRDAGPVFGRCAPSSARGVAGGVLSGHGSVVAPSSSAGVAGGPWRCPGRERVRVRGRARGESVRAGVRVARASARACERAFCLFSAACGLRTCASEERVRVGGGRMAGAGRGRGRGLDGGRGRCCLLQVVYQTCRALRGADSS